MKCVHIFIPERHYKFSVPYIKFIKENIGDEDHLFIQYQYKGSKLDWDYEKYINIPDSYFSMFFHLKHLFKAEKIILHSLSSHMIFLFLLFPFLLKKSAWVIWGGDLYYYLLPKSNIRSKLYEFARKKVIKNMGAIITVLKKQYEYVKKWYSVTGKHYETFSYPSNLFKDYDMPIEKSDNISFLVGHSASETNNHLNVFKMLEKYAHNNIEVICPLSYSETEEYRSQVIAEGERIFTHGFTPIIEFLPFEEYIKLIKNIDIAIFDNKRQQAFGNIITLLGFGAKVYLRKDSALYEFFNELGVKVFLIENFDLELLDEKTKNMNIQLIKKRFSEETLKNELISIFND